jgi:hypothetical protein
MKNCLLALSAVLFLTSCAGVKVRHTEIATGATGPRAIYIRPFDVTATVFKGRHSNTGEREIRRSLAPAEFAQILKEELEQIAPARVLKEDETAPHGWIVEGQFDVIHAGSPLMRYVAGPTSFGRSTVVLHVRVIDVGRKVIDSGKNKATAYGTGTATSEGTVIYEFDLTGGSGATGRLGSITAPGLGYATPFDFRNAAERIKMALTPDAHRYGVRTSATIR